MYDVLIIGAGVVGALTARELSRYKLSVCLVDKDYDAGCGASRANSGIVHAGFDAKVGTLKAKLNVEGCLMMPKVAEELDVEYKNTASIVVCMAEEDMPALQELYERGKINGVKNLEIVDRERLRQMEPNPIRLRSLLMLLLNILVQQNLKRLSHRDVLKVYFYLVLISYLNGQILERQILMLQILKFVYKCLKCGLHLLLREIFSSTRRR